MRTATTRRYSYACVRVRMRDDRVSKLRDCEVTPIPHSSATHVVVDEYAAPVILFPDVVVALAASTRLVASSCVFAPVDFRDLRRERKREEGRWRRGEGEGKKGREEEGEGEMERRRGEEKI